MPALETMLNFLVETLRLGLRNLWLHKLRSLLTALGIILGVAAVIVMVAIGEGNKQVALEKIRQLGARNIIVRSVKPAEPESGEQENQSRILVYGVKTRDLDRIDETVTPVKRVVPLKEFGAQIGRGHRQIAARAFGTTPELRQLAALRIERGRYLLEDDLQQQRPVAVIGDAVAKRLFPLEDPLESSIEVDGQLFQIVGVLRSVGVAGGAGASLVGRDLNFDIHAPITTVRSRFSDRVIKRNQGQISATEVELYELYIEVPEDGSVLAVADQVRRVIQYEHPDMESVQIIVPAELVEQERAQRVMMDTLLVSIAAISLLVGGIGIMNIMLASVTERTREIGIRRAVGATRRHIVAQFLAETTVLSGMGGVIGIAVGMGGAAFLGLIHSQIEGIELPIVRGWAVGVSFFVATMVGIVFGLYPAVKASRQDPIVALRHD